MLPNSATSSFMQSSRLGLASTSHSDGKKRAERKTMAGREGPLWESVEITREHATSPALRCKNCNETFCGGATRIRSHIIDKCKCESEEFLKLKEKMIKEHDNKEEAKKQKTG